MARPTDDLAAQVTPGRASPDYAGEQVNRGSDEVLARQAADAGVTGPHPGRRKVSAADANYVENGPPPFVCGNCRFILYDKGAPSGDLCQIVDGPYPEGHIDPGDTCRLWSPKPDARNASRGFASEPDGKEVPSGDDLLR